LVYKDAHPGILFFSPYTFSNVKSGSYTVYLRDNQDVACKEDTAIEIKTPPCALIFPTQTTCCNDLGPNTNNFQLQQVCMTLIAGKVTNAIPGVFSYYDAYTPTTTGQVTIHIKPLTGGLQPFVIQGENQVRVLVDACQTVAYASTHSGGNATATFNGIAGKKYVISVK
jgi:hypothetical protein